jgi:hypothetical protein
MALAHHLITVVFQVLSRNEKYVELGGDYYDQRSRNHVARRLVERLTRLGYYVELRTPAPEPIEAPVPMLALNTDVRQLQQASPPPAFASASAAAPKRKRGRPCKCADRGIVCKHKASIEPISLIRDMSSPGTFS